MEDKDKSEIVREYIEAMPPRERMMFLGMWVNITAHELKVKRPTMLLTTREIMKRYPELPDKVYFRG